MANNMLLRDKQTGKLVNKLDIYVRSEGVVFDNDFLFSSIKDLTDRFEDAGNVFYSINTDGDIICEDFVTDYHNDCFFWNKVVEKRKKAHNYFLTREEAEEEQLRRSAITELREYGLRYHESTPMEEGYTGIGEDSFRVELTSEDKDYRDYVNDREKLDYLLSKIFERRWDEIGSSYPNPIVALTDNDELVCNKVSAQKIDSGKEHDE